MENKTKETESKYRDARHMASIAGIGVYLYIDPELKDMSRVHFIKLGENGDLFLLDADAISSFLIVDPRE
jgi:hypothetical protein